MVNLKVQISTPLVENRITREYSRHGALFGSIEAYCAEICRRFRHLPTVVSLNYLVIRHETGNFHVQQIGAAENPAACNIEGAPANVKIDCLQSTAPASF